MVLEEHDLFVHLDTTPDGHWEGEDDEDVGEEGDQSSANSAIIPIILRCAVLRLKVFRMLNVGLHAANRVPLGHFQLKQNAVSFINLPW